MAINLPYSLTDGNTAYADKLMANLNAILTALNNLTASGVGTGDIQTIISGLAAAMACKVDSAETGNASDIVFSDGDTLQEKLDNETLNGTDGVTAYVPTWAAFHYDATNGHLYVSTSSATNPFSIVDNNLKCTVPDPDGEGDVVTYDLGVAKGEKGDTGDVTTAAMQTYVAQQIAALAGSSTVSTSVLAKGNYAANNASWDDREAEPTYMQAKIACAGVTASNNFIVQPSSSATEAECSLWAAANPRVISQETGFITLEALGVLPDADIPLNVVINI